MQITASPLKSNTAYVRQRSRPHRGLERMFVSSANHMDHTAEAVLVLDEVPAKT